MMPKLALAGVAVRFGLAKLGWLNRSNASARNCRLNRSVILVFLESCRSTSLKFGPISAFRPRSPKWYTFTDFDPAAVPLTGTANTAPAGHVPPVRGSHTAVLANHCTLLPTNVG